MNKDLFFAKFNFIQFIIKKRKCEVKIGLNIAKESTKDSEDFFHIVQWKSYQSEHYVIRFIFKIKKNIIVSDINTVMLFLLRHL